MSSGPDLHLDLGPDDLDIVDPDSYLNGFPHGTFQRLRDHDPVSWWPEHDGGKGFWAVTRYEDLLYVSQHVELFSSAQGITLEEIEGDDFHLRRNMLEYDPPEHTRYRRLVSKPFSRREVYAYEEGIRGLARDVVLEARNLGEHFDYVDRVAKQLPMRMLGRLLGVPDGDGDWLVEQGDALLGNLDPEMTQYPVGLTDTDEFKHIPFRSPAALELYRYAEEQAELRKGCPAHDVIGKLLEPTIDGEAITDLQFKNFFVLMVSAGNDTTRYTMAAGIKVAEHPDQFAELRQACIDGNSELVERAVEEVLRWGSVTMHFRRTATQDTELRGKQIKAGDKVVIWFSSADFDERQFPDPYRFDIHRTPNDHVAFNLRSPHLCLGAQLARMELKVLFEELLPRIRAVQLDGPSERLRSDFICGMKRLPVKVEWA